MIIFLGAIILLLPLWPILTLLRKQAFLRRLSMFPRMLLILSGAIVLYLMLSLLLLVQFPGYLPYVVATGFPIMGYFYYWRARPTFGARKGLPPGRLTIAPVGPWVDYLYYRKQADRYGSILKMNHFIHPMVCITGIELGTEFLKNHEDSTITPPMPFNQNIPDGFMRYMPQALHMAYRERMKTIFFDHAFLETKEEALGQIIKKHLSEMAKDIEQVHPAPHLHQMAFAVFVELFLGLSSQDPNFDRVRALYRQIDYRHSWWLSTSRSEKCLNELENIFLNRAKTQDSLFGQFLKEDIHRRGGLTPDKTLLRNFIYLLQTSSIDVADLLVWIFKLLSDHPVWAENFRRDLHSGNSPENQSAKQSAHHVVLETLRLEQSEYLMRKAGQDIYFGGFLIPKGWLIRIGVRESHRDAHMFADPHEFKPERFAAHSFSAKEYAPFGMYQKTCVGKGLTFWIGQRFVLELVRGFEWEKSQDGPRELGYFHWRPSADFRVRMSTL